MELILLTEVIKVEIGMENTDLIILNRYPVL